MFIIYILVDINIQNLIIKLNQLKLKQYKIFENLEYFFFKYYDVIKFFILFKYLYFFELKKKRRKKFKDWNIYKISLI